MSFPKMIVWHLPYLLSLVFNNFEAIKNTTLGSMTKKRTYANAFKY